MGTSMGTTKSFQIQSEEWERKMDKQQDDFSTIPGYLRVIFPKAQRNLSAGEIRATQQ